MCKAISERLYIDYANKQEDIKVVLCRYGNVLESTGSVIPFFKNLLQNGCTHLPITDERMTRFSITLEESVDLIEWTYNHEKSHGCIVVPKLPSIRVVDLAKKLAENHGVPELPLKIIGIRQGEKLHEDMVSFEESLRCIEYEKYFLISDNILSEPVDGYTYSSNDRVLESDEVTKFLLDKGVI
jgi:UDP-N-acetylglucosamine 4,6-dehydratase